MGEVVTRTAPSKGLMEVATGNGRTVATFTDWAAEDREVQMRSTKEKGDAGRKAVLLMATTSDENGKKAYLVSALGLWLAGIAGAMIAALAGTAIVAQVVQYVDATATKREQTVTLNYMKDDLATIKSTLSAMNVDRYTGEQAVKDRAALTNLITVNAADISEVNKALNQVRERLLVVETNQKNSHANAVTP